MTLNKNKLLTNPSLIPVINRNMGINMCQYYSVPFKNLPYPYYQKHVR